MYEIELPQRPPLFGKDTVQMTVMTLDADSLEGCFDENVTLLPFSSIFPIDLYLGLNLSLEIQIFLSDHLHISSFII